VVNWDVLLTRTPPVQYSGLAVGQLPPYQPTCSRTLKNMGWTAFIDGSYDASVAARLATASPHDGNWSGAVDDWMAASVNDTDASAVNIRRPGEGCNLTVRGLWSGAGCGSAHSLP
jgi:hypothetical protein